MDDSRAAESLARPRVAGKMRVLRSVVSAKCAVKVILAVIALAAFAYMTGSWEVGLIVLLGIGWHEHGHICAMHREGIQTEGFYFIPFIGGVALAKGEVPSRAADIRISLAGPLFGLLMCFAAMSLYAATQEPIFALAVRINAAINLFNLLPIYPLDGGRVLRAVAVDDSSIQAKRFLVVTLTLIALLCLVVRLPLILLIGVIAYLSLMADIRRLSEQEEKKAFFTAWADHLLESPDFWDALELEECAEREEFRQSLKEMAQGGFSREACNDLRVSEGIYGGVVYWVLIVTLLAAIATTISVPGLDAFMPN